MSYRAIQTVARHLTTVFLDSTHCLASQHLKGIWQQIDDSPTAFEPPDLGVDAATIEWRQQLRVDTQQYWMQFICTNIS
jgi:hypothetical protein